MKTIDRKKIVMMISVIFAGALLTTNYIAAGEEQGPLGAFAIFATNSYNHQDSEVEGRVYAGSANLKNGAIASGYDSENVLGYYLEQSDYPSLVTTSSLTNVNTTITGAFIDGQEQTIDNQSYISKLEGIVNTLSTITLAAESDVSLNGESASVSASETNLLVIDYSNFNQNQQITEINLENLTASQYLVIRGDEETIDFTKTLVNLNQQLVELGIKDTEDTNVETLANNIVWVFPESEQINITDSQVVGTIIAPQATITIDNSLVYGQVYGNNVNLINDSLVANFIGFFHEHQFGEKVKTVTTTLEFVDEAGTEIAESVELVAPVGEVVAYNKTDIDGYVAVDETTVEQLNTGFTVKKNQVLTITYSEVTTATITVYHQLTDGSDIVTPIEIVGDINSVYTTSPLTDSAYLLIETPENASGIITGDTSVIYIYAPVGSTYTVTINHLDVSNKKIATTQYAVLPQNSAYDVSDYIGTNRVYEYIGLKADSSPVSGNLTSDITVSFEYQIVSTCPQLSEELVSGANSGQSYSLSNFKRVTSKEIEYDTITNYLVEQTSVANSQSGINFGNAYTSEDTNNGAFFKYNVDSSSSYSQFFPVTQSGSFSPVNFVLTENGNSYDLRARTSTSNLNTYTNSQLGYQSTLATAGYQSLLVRFEECQLVVSHTSANGTVTEIGRYSYSDFPGLGKASSGFAFDYNSSTMKLTISLINQSNSKLEYSGNTVTVDLSSYNFKPNNYNLLYSDSADTTTKVFAPYVSVDRHMLELISLNSPYIDTTSTKVSASTMISRNKLYLAYSKNGVMSSRTNLTSTSVITDKSLTYNPQSYKTISTSSTMGTGVYAYIAGSSYKVPNTNLTLKAEQGIVYGKQSHPSYTMSANSISVNMQASQYTSILDIPSYQPAITVTKNGEVVTNSSVKTAARNYIIDDSKVDYHTVGTYSAIGYVRSRDDVTGMYISGEVQISLTVSAATNDYGDAPSTYGDGGAKIGTSSYRYTIGINRNGNRASHADAEGSPQYSDDGLGDDTLGMSDEDGWFNMDPNGTGELNIQMDSIKLSFPYTSTGTATVGLWLDFNQNGIYEASEGYVQNVTSSSYDKYGMVTFNVNLKPDGSTLTSGDYTFVRVRILRGSNAFTTADAGKTFSTYGETEDINVHFYGKETSAQICTSSLANTPIITVKSVTNVTKAGPNNDETGIKYTVDIGDSSMASIAPNSYYQNVTITITSKQGIVSNTSAGEPTFFRVEKNVSPYESPANTIHISVRDKSGNPLNLPLTFTLWDLDDFTSSNVVESVSLSKDKLFLEGLFADNIGLTYDTVGVVEDNSNFLKLFTTKQVESEPSAAFYINGDSLALADMEIVEEARLLEIGMGLDLNEMTMLISECIEPYEPKAQIQIFDQFYDDEVNVYNSYPFAYQSTNIAFPYFTNFNNVTQNLTIPEGVEFTDGDDSVKIYRRSFLGDRGEDDWELVDSKYYTQTIVGNTSSVTFNNPVANKLYGYEYRMEYNFEIDESMKTGQKVVFKSNVVYNKGISGEYSETYQLNDVTAYVRDAFTMDINTVTNDETIYVDNSSKVLSYTYEYANCDSCEGVDVLTPFTSEIDIPIVSDDLLSYSDNSEFARYEEIILSIYDNEMKVFEIPIRRWKQAANAQVVVSGDIQLYDQLNPVTQTIQIRAAYKKYSGFEQPVKINYSAEQINVSASSTLNLATGGIFDPNMIDVEINTTPLTVVPASWDSDVLEILPEQLVTVDSDILTAYAVDNASIITANLNSDLLDDTLEGSTSTIKGTSYQDIYYDDHLTVEDGVISLTANLAQKYVIEEFSGRIYNLNTETECNQQYTLVNNTEVSVICNNLASYDNYALTNNQIVNGYNDEQDTDVVITNTGSQLPLAVDNEAGTTSKYYLSLVNFGLSSSSLIYEHRLQIDTKELSYYQDDGKYYFRRQQPSDSAVTCIKAESCNGEFITITEGSVDSVSDVRNDVLSQADIGSSYQSIIDDMSLEW